MFFAGGASWALDPCQARLNYAIFLNRHAGRAYFHVLYKYIGIISYKQFGPLFWKLIWIYYYLLNGIGLDLELHNSNLVQKILLILLTTVMFGFSNTTHYLTQRFDCTSNCWTDNSRKLSHFSNGISSWLILFFNLTQIYNKINHSQVR